MSVSYRLKKTNNHLFILKKQIIFKKLFIKINSFVGSYKFLVKY